MSSDTTRTAPLPEVASTAMGSSANLPPLNASTPAQVGRFVLLGELARGGMGVVYRGHDPSFDREVAVKVLSDHLVHRPEAVRRFLEEARVTGQLQHPGIPPVHDVGELPGARPFLAMKLIKGQTLESQLKERADPAEERGRFIAVFEAVCQAVGYAHDHGVIHRDLKPANVMVGSFGEVQVMDWGLAKVLKGDRLQSEGTDPDATLGTEIRTARGVDAETQAGSFLGTPAFMPPEQAIGAVDQIDRRSDVFGLGAILCVILTGKPPYGGSDAESTRRLAARAKLDDAFERLDRCEAEPDLVALAKRCLSAEPDQRPNVAGEVAASIATFRGAAESRARQAELDRATARVRAVELRKRYRMWAALAAGVVLLAGLCVAVLWRDEEQRRQRSLEQAWLKSADTTLRLTQMAATQDYLNGLNAAEVALRRGEAGTVVISPPPDGLPKAHESATGGESIDLRQRYESLARSRDTAIKLDRIREASFTWVAEQNTFDSLTPKRDYPVVFAEYGIPIADPAAASAKVNDSPIRDRLVAALEQWLAVTRGEDECRPVLALLDRLDPDDYRCKLRLALADRAVTDLQGWLSLPAAESLPPRILALVGGMWSDLPNHAGLPLLRRATLAHPNNFDLLFSLAIRLGSQTPPPTDEAIGYYRAALALRPDSSAVLNNLGLLLKDKKDTRGAMASYRTALSKDPANRQARTNLGHLLLEGGETAAAKVEFEQVVRDDPNSFSAQLGLALIAEKAKDRAAVDRAYKRLIEIGSNPQFARVSYGKYLMMQNARAEAAEQFREAIEKGPDSAVIRFLYAGVHLQSGKQSEGIAQLEAALKLEPNYGSAHLQLARLAILKEDWATALPRIRAALDAGVPSPLDYTTLAFTCRVDDRYALIADIYFAALRAHPAWARDRNLLARESAAKAAARAGTGNASDAPADPTARRKLRMKSLTALRAELDELTGLADGERDMVQRRMRNWQSDSDLAWVRSADRLAQFSLDERLAWEAFWEDVERARLATAPGEVAPTPRAVKP